MADYTYRVKVGNAEYEVVAPDENTAWAWANQAHAQQSFAPPPTPTPTAAPTAAPTPAPVAAPPKERPGFLDYLQSNTTDYIARPLKGLLGGVEMGTNIFDAGNPVSEILRGAQEGINEYLVSDTAKQKAEERSKRLEGKGFFGTLKEVPGIVADDPALLAETLGTALPSIGVALLTGGSSAGVQTAAMLGTGAAMGSGAIKGSIYATTKEELLKTGRVTEEEAEQAASEAQSYAGENLDMIALGTALGAIASRTGMEPTAARLLAGRIVGKSVGQAAGREAMETALRQSAQKGAVRTAVEEATLEGAQGAQEKLAANLALQRQGMDVDLMEGVGSAAALEGTLGGILGGGLGIAGRGIPTEAPPEAKLADSPQVEQEYLRLVTAEAQALRDQNPNLTQRQAFNQAMKDAGKLYDTALTNILFGAEGETDVAADADTAVDVLGGGVAGTAPDLGAAPPVAGAPDLGEADAGRLGEPLPSVPVPTVGTGAGEPALAPITAAPEVAPLPAFDPTPIMEAPNRKERVSAASQLISDITMANPELQALPKKIYTQAANQMATAASRGQQFDPVDIVYNVAGVERPAPVPAAPAPEVAPIPAAPSIDEVAVAPVKAAIEAAAAPAPVVPGAMPSLAQTSAREMGITPTTVAPEAVVETATAGTLLPKGDTPLETFSGEPVLQHGRADTQAGGPLEGFTTPEAVTPGQRYGVEGEDLGGVFGSEGVYLASDPKWFTDMSGMYTPDIYDVSAPLENALVLTPDNIGSLPKKDTPWKGKEIADWAKSQGYDGVVVEGFDDLSAKLEAAQQPLGPEAPEGPEFTPRGFKRSDFPQEAALSDLETTSVGIPSDPNFATGADVFRGYLRSKNVDPEIGQDQVFAFNPEKLKVLGKAKGPAGRVSMRTATPSPATITPPAPQKPEVVSNGKPVVLTEAQTRTALAKAKAYREKMNRIQKRIAATNDMADVLSGGIDLVKLARGDKENLALLRGAVDTLDVGKWKLILPTLSTEDIFRILKGRVPGLTEADRVIREDVTRFQTKEYLRLSEELEQVAAFLKQYPKAAQALSDLEFATVAYQVDPTKADSAEAYFNKVDGQAKELRVKIKAEKDAKKKGRLETKLKTRFEEIKSIYTGVPGDERVIGWRDLGRPEFGGGKGREIFKLLRDGHRRDLEAKYDALRSRLMESKEDEALDEALEKLEAQFKPALDQVIYFPAMRFGSYYARVGKGANSIFKMFDTETQRNQFARVMEARGEEVTETGNVEDLRNEFAQVTGDPLKEVLDLFDDNPKDIGALKSQVFDLWLQTMSSGDMRKHMAPRKMRAGYSTDILKNFANFRRSSINDVKRAKYGYKLRNEISRAKDYVSEQPDREKMGAFVKEVELRTLGDLMPPDRSHPFWEAALQLGNKAAFYQYLANPKTAVIQLTQLHIVALPMLAQKYGSAKATAALAKYGFSGLGGFAASPLKAIKREDGSFTFDWEQPNLLDNPISTLKEESDPELYEVLSEGWNEGRDLNLYMDTFANQIGGYGTTDPQQRSALQELMQGRVHTAAWRGATFALEAMGTLMHQMERVNREATYMASLELAYRENKKSGQTHAQAKKNAIESAVETTLAATFDFSSYNKPRALTTGVGRLAGQFMSYPYMMSSLLVRNMYTAIKVGDLEPGERKAAIQMATGTLLNMFAYAGVTGIPLYGIFTTVASLALWAASQFDDEDEEGALSYIDENGNIKATYNVDWWFRNVWIPKFLGLDGTSANLFGMDDATAELAALALEKGPISALTDVDLANSVALDFMFFVPKESRAETPEGKIVEYTFSGLTGAFGNMVMDYIKAGKDLMNGYTNRALERTPKLFGNIAKANRFAEEGQLNYNRELVGMGPEFWSDDKVILQALGFASTEASQRQQQNYEGKTITVEVGKAREDFLNKLRKVALDRYQYGPTPEVMAAEQKIRDDWVEFNRTYPTNVIGIDSFHEVQVNAVNDAIMSHATRGLPMDEKTPYLRDLYLRRLEAERE